MDLISYTKYFGALAAIIILILAIGFVLKRINKNKIPVSAQHSDIFNSKSASLFIQEVLPIDQKTKVIIVGRDNLRHVILLGENHSQLIETVTPEPSNGSQHSELTASKQVGSIRTPVQTTFKVDKTPEINLPSTPDDAKKPDSQEQAGPKQELKVPKSQDLENDLEFKDKQPKNSDLKDIKDKLQDAKALAEPEK
ncbi:MAG: hypothetical protein COB24_05045 [Hyphomicrobiales bacterium]|nr:MAG: hypothetical protein COB24_05045 [Hyphomicrobiales bacterium]